MTAAPDYYREFHCLAGECRHSCCVGWEIDIDPETAARYRALPGEEWAWLRESIVGDPPRFLLDEAERCPCLREDGLCRLILTLGEESLCQICRDHPRFRNEWPGRTEIGVGACCEEAARLILSQEKPLTLTEDGSFPEGKAARTLWDLREELFDMVFDPALSPDEAEDAILRRTGARLPEGGPIAWAKYFLGLERLDDAWTACLTRLMEREGDPAAFARHMADREREYRNMLAYFLYRHLPEALEDGNAASRAGFAVLSVRLIRALGAARYAGTAVFTRHDQEALFRMYSAEVEYSEPNLNALYDLLWEAAGEE